MVLLVLDGLDSELEHSKHCRDAVVRVLDALLRGDAGLRLLLTCEHSLLFNSSERLSNALEWGVLVDVSYHCWRVTYTQYFEVLSRYFFDSLLDYRCSSSRTAPLCHLHHCLQR
jgi:hypothetical protein